MIGFRVKNIQDTNLGVELKSWREKRNLTPEKLAQIASVQTKYVIAFEKGDYGRLPELIYAKNFLRSYLKALGLKQEKFLNAFEKEWGVYYKTKKDTRTRLGNELKSHHFIETPRVVKIILAVIIGFTIVGYLLWQVNHLLKPPILEIAYPREDITTTEAQITITGQTSSEASITINDQNVITDGQGKFEYDLGLQRGLNIVTIKAYRRHSRPQIVYRKIVLESNQQFN